MNLFFFLDETFLCMWKKKNVWKNLQKKVMIKKWFVRGFKMVLMTFAAYFFWIFSKIFTNYLQLLEIIWITVKIILLKNS